MGACARLLLLIAAINVLFWLSSPAWSGGDDACYYDADCPPTWFCGYKLGSKELRCIRQPMNPMQPMLRQCLSNGSCPDGMTCRSLGTTLGACMFSQPRPYGPCQSDTDCGMEQACQRAAFNAAIGTCKLVVQH